MRGVAEFADRKRPIAFYMRGDAEFADPGTLIAFYTRGDAEFADRQRLIASCTRGDAVFAADAAGHWMRYLLKIMAIGDVADTGFVNEVKQASFRSYR